MLTINACPSLVLLKVRKKLLEVRVPDDLRGINLFRKLIIVIVQSTVFCFHHPHVSLTAVRIKHAIRVS